MGGRGGVPVAGGLGGQVPSFFQFFCVGSHLDGEWMRLLDMRESRSAALLDRMDGLTSSKCRRAFSSRASGVSMLRSIQ